jgi:hypothetical protein
MRVLRPARSSLGRRCGDGGNRRARETCTLQSRPEVLEPGQRTLRVGDTGLRLLEPELRSQRALFGSACLDLGFACGRACPVNGVARLRDASLGRSASLHCVLDRGAMPRQLRTFLSRRSLRDGQRLPGAHQLVVEGRELDLPGVTSPPRSGQPLGRAGHECVQALELLVLSRDHLPCAFDLGLCLRNDRCRVLLARHCD